MSPIQDEPRMSDEDLVQEEQSRRPGSGHLFGLPPLASSDVQPESLSPFRCKHQDGSLPLALADHILVSEDPNGCKV